MTVVTVPGEYYEKFIRIVSLLCGIFAIKCLSSFDIYSIVRRNEETMLIK